MPRKQRKKQTSRHGKQYTRRHRSNQPRTGEPHTIRAIHLPPPTRQASKQPDQEEPGRWGGTMTRGKNRKERKTATMEHRKQPSSAISVVPHHLIRMTRTIRYQASNHPPSSPTSRRAYHEPPALVRSDSLPISLVEERGETKRQASNADTPDNAKSLPSSHPTDLTDRHGASNRTATGTGTRRLTSTPSPPPSKQGETPDTIASPLPAANRREARTRR